MSKQNRLMIIGITILGILVIGATFAIWLVSDKQTGYNKITAGCVNISFNNGNGTLSFENAAPMSDEDGLELTGYTFTLRNNCNSEVSYLLNLDLFNVANQTNLSTSEIKLAIDNKVPRKIAYYDDTAKNSASAYGAKTLTSGKLAARTSETHTVKMWVDVNTTTQNAVFSNRLFVMASPNLTVPELASDDCFIMDPSDSGLIRYYLAASPSCPDNVIVPNTINGNAVTYVDRGAFLDGNVITWERSDGNGLDVVVIDEDNYDDIEDVITYLFDNSISNKGVIGLSSIDTYNIYKLSEYTDWDDLIADYDWYPTHNQCVDSGCGTGYEVLNVPTDNVNLASLYNQFIDVDIDIIIAYARTNGRSLWDQDSSAVNHYIESIDFSKCLSLEGFDSDIAFKDDNLERVEFPNNPLMYFESNAFCYAGLNSLYLPTYDVTVGNTAFLYNNITHLELYGSDSFIIGRSSFANNQISSLVVNSDISFGMSINNSQKPFRDNPLTSSGITIGYNINNTVGDFIDINNP